MLSLKLIFITLFMVCVFNQQWPANKAWTWYKAHSWSAGVNYIPSYAANEIQMWESMNLTRITEELSWANRIGFSKLRVFLHVQPYIDSPSDFLTNISKFLLITKSKKIDVMFVLFDDCWRPTYHSGQQPAPIPGIHNSQWVQCPGDVVIQESVLKSYVIDIMSKFKEDTGIVMWDLYNEVGNSGRVTKTLPLLKKIFQWARQVNPSQPLTSGFWNGSPDFKPINEYIFANSDVITFHIYDNVSATQNLINELKIYGRPTVCTEYMARTRNSKFITHLPVFKKQQVWAISWGFVFGKTQTYYPWQSKEGSPVPAIWFHDVVHPNGTPFDDQEQVFIRNITKINQRSTETKNRWNYI